MSDQLISSEKNLSSTSPVNQGTDQNGHENNHLHFNLFCVKKYFSWFSGQTLIFLLQVTLSVATASPTTGTRILITTSTTPLSTSRSQ